MNRFITSLFCILCVAVLNAQTPSVMKVIEDVATEEHFACGIVGVKAMTVSGEVIADWNSCVRLLPASNVKVISTGLAMDKLGPDYRFETGIGYNGEIRDGVLKGDLYIIGSGDPTLGLGGSGARSATFGQWWGILKNAGINAIEGRIIADHRSLGVIPVNPAWLLEDITCGDGLDSRGLNYAKNVVDFVHLFNPYFITEQAPLDTCAAAFGEYLLAGGFPFRGEYADDSAEGVVGKSQMTILGSSKSDKLSKIAAFTNYTSDNFYAEALMNNVLHDSSLAAAMQSIGVEDLRGCRIVDGCGLSRKDYVSAAFFCDFLAAMAGRDCFPEYLRSLPQPGKGTLASRLHDEPSSLKNRIYMKSGSMNGVRCFSGYVMPRDKDSSEIIVFSVLTNNVIAPSRLAFSGIDSIIASIARQN